MKDTTTEKEKNADANLYKFSEMKVDGMSYQIVSVTPKGDENYTPKTASELIKYLINGK